MIFVTVGSMFPFDRLIQAMDDWARTRPGLEVLAQIGDGNFTPRHMTWVRRLERPAFVETVTRADVVVAHAGIGSVLTARTVGTPIVLLPRRQQLGEHTSDHQMESAVSLRGREGIFVADSESELVQVMGSVMMDKPTAAQSSPSADPVFLSRIRGFIDTGAQPGQAR